MDLFDYLRSATRNKIISKTILNRENEIEEREIVTAIPETIDFVAEDTVSINTVFGIDSTPGVKTTFSRGDHSHGIPKINVDGVTIIGTGDESSPLMIRAMKGGANLKTLAFQITQSTKSLVIANMVAYLVIPETMNGLMLQSCFARVIVAGAAGSANMFNITVNGSSMLSTPLMINAGSLDSSTAATQYVIDSNHKTIYTNDLVGINISQLNTTAPMGLTIIATFG